MPSPKSAQLAYGARRSSWLASKNCSAHLVQRCHASVAAAREIDGREVERQTEQVVAQRAGDELIDLIADLNRRAAHDLTRRIGAALQVGQRIEEGVDQAQLLIARRSGSASTTLPLASMRSTVSRSSE